MMFAAFGTLKLLLVALLFNEAAAVKLLIGRTYKLAPRKRRKNLGDFEMKLPDDTTITIEDVKETFPRGNRTLKVEYKYNGNSDIRTTHAGVALEKCCEPRFMKGERYVVIKKGGLSFGSGKYPRGTVLTISEGNPGTNPSGSWVKITSDGHGAQTTCDAKTLYDETAIPFSLENAATPGIQVLPPASSYYHTPSMLETCVKPTPIAAAAELPPRTTRKRNRAEWTKNVVCKKCETKQPTSLAAAELQWQGWKYYSDKFWYCKECKVRCLTCGKDQTTKPHRWKYDTLGQKILWFCPDHAGHLSRRRLLERLQGF